jgi:transcriptional regulator with XRE-family HTH domain
MCAFGARLRTLRVAAGLSQEHLAAKCALLPRAISELELGREEPDLDLIVRLCRCLGITPGVLMADLRAVCEGLRG